MLGHPLFPIFFKNDKIIMILVTIYTNLGAEGVIYGINQTQSHYVCTSQELLPKLIKVLDKVRSLEFAFS